MKAGNVRVVVDKIAVFVKALPLYELTIHISHLTLMWTIFQFMQLNTKDKDTKQSQTKTNNPA